MKSNSPSAISAWSVRLDEYSIEERALLRFADADETSIATRLASTPLLVAGHSVDSGVGPRWLAPAGARGRDVHTGNNIHHQVVADKAVGLAVDFVDAGQHGLCDNR